MTERPQRARQHPVRDPREDMKSHVYSSFTSSSDDRYSYGRYKYSWESPAQCGECCLACSVFQ